MKDFKGIRSGKLVAVSLHHYKNKVYYWNCQCDCGKVKVINAFNVYYGVVKSCGCSTGALISAKVTKHGHFITNNKEFRTWRCMKKRCSVTKAVWSKNYSGRGIKVCERWINSFDDFLQDMGPAPSAKHTIERIDNNQNYEPGNCKWATYTEQLNNKRSNRLHEMNGAVKTLTDWCRYFNIRTGLVYDRLKSGWSIDMAISKPPRKVNRVYKKNAWVI